MWPEPTGLRHSLDRGERRHRHHLVDVCYGEDPAVAVADDGSEGVVDPSPAKSSEYRQERDAAEAYRLVVEKPKAKRLVSGRAAVVGALALEHGPEGVGVIEDHEVGRGVHAHLETGSNLSLVVRAGADERDTVCGEECLDRILDDIAPGDGRGVEDLAQAPP